MHPEIVSLFHYSTGESGGKGRSYWMFFPWKLYGGSILIFSIGQLLFTCIITVIKIHIHPPYSEQPMWCVLLFCFFFFMRMSPALLKTARCVCRDLTWRLEGRETAQSKVVIGVVTRGPCDTDSRAHKASGINNMKFLLGQVKGSLVKITFFFLLSSHTNWWWPPAATQWHVVAMVSIAYVPCQGCILEEIWFFFVCFFLSIFLLQSESSVTRVSNLTVSD